MWPSSKKLRSTLGLIRGQTTRNGTRHEQKPTQKPTRSETLPFRRHTLSTGSGPTPTAVYATQYRGLAELENRENGQDKPHAKSVDPAIRELKAQVEQSRAVLSARNSDDQIVDIATLKEQIASTRSDLHASVRKANDKIAKMAAWKEACHSGVPILHVQISGPSEVPGSPWHPRYQANHASAAGGA
jgi:hypothetical protein